MGWAGTPSPPSLGQWAGWPPENGLVWARHRQRRGPVTVAAVTGRPRPSSGVRGRRRATARPLGHPPCGQRPRGHDNHRRPPMVLCHDGTAGAMADPDKDGSEKRWRPTEVLPPSRCRFNLPPSQTSQPTSQAPTPSTAQILVLRAHAARRPPSRAAATVRKPGVSGHHCRRRRRRRGGGGGRGRGGVTSGSHRRRAAGDGGVS